LTFWVNSDCDFILFVTAQPADAILYFSHTQDGICLCRVEFYHFVGCFLSWSTSSRSLYHFFITFFCCHLDYSCGNILYYLKLHTLSARRRYMEVFFNGCF